MTSVTKSVVRERIQAPDPPLAEALDMVEARLTTLLQSREALLTDISGYLIGAGGKRVRPLVTILMFRACGGREAADIIDVATALELIHSATLLHDDIIDNSAVRRGRDSAFRRYGLAKTLVTGDFIFSRAFQLCARFEEKLINWAAEACVSLTEGEIMQGRYRRNPDVTLDDYLEIIGRKTASIFQQGARTAAYLARAAEPVVEAMASCGFHVGMTFQMVDDLLDVQGDERRLGKPVGIDLREGNPSLPLVLSLRGDAEVARVFQKTAPTEREIEQALLRIRSGEALPRARTLAAEYAARARGCMAALSPSADKDHLLSLIDQLVERAE